tara:strand:- start:8156 stop:9826 length:1671 start_codon:yes stop_codon:yes gene_type:complete
MSTLNKLMDGYNPHKALMEQTKGLVNKWSPTGLLEGLNGETETHGMSILLENQARQLIDESSKTGTSANSEEWAGVALPLVRRVFGEIAAKDFVSVQPMNLPSGLVFYLNFKYGSAQAGFTQSGNIHGTTEVAGDASGGLYGAGRFGYSINDLSHANTGDFTSAATADATTGLPVNITSASLDSASVNFNEDINLATSAIVRTRFDASKSGIDLNGVRAFQISSSAGESFDTFYPEYTTATLVSGNTYDIDFVVGNADNSQVVFVTADTVTVDYHKQPTDISRGDFEASPSAGTDGGFAGEGDAGIPEIDVAMESKAIVAKTRKLKAVWTPELAQDLNAYHSVDAEAELTSMLSEYISMEIDLEILDMLIQNALTTEHWSAQIGYEYNSANVGFEQVSSANGYAYTKNEWFQTLGNKIQRVSNKIHQKTMRGGANFLVCGPDVATVLESIPGFNVSTDGNSSSFAMGVQQVGTLNNRFTVYKNPYMLEDTILVGFRGSNFLETGAVYAPYIPLIMTPLVYDPVNFTPRKGVMTRYAKKMVRSEFYGKIKVAGLQYI